MPHPYNYCCSYFILAIVYCYGSMAGLSYFTVFVSNQPPYVAVVVPFKQLCCIKFILFHIRLFQLPYVAAVCSTTDAVCCCICSVLAAVCCCICSVSAAVCCICSISAAVCCCICSVSAAVCCRVGGSGELACRRG